MKRSPARSRKEPTIALINIVFLMLVFFMVAGTLAPPVDGDLALVETAALEGREPPDALVIGREGQLRHRGNVLPSAVAFLEQPDRQPDDVVRLMPDRALPAADLLRISSELRAAGAGKIMISTERALQ
ncbi:ExbD/TolR family protein [Lentibacter sp. XHP0401]|jgi:biopolymer transport protein ExbD|uniref:ExbD/TolR family protein n=1 Tax=Lentibacter sp. XHP0401 TaxID=2984334 RepID=UPI0021E93C74|nr:biopolymer transporter ExbD [Lentibacter sp. XHP0401]MCV2894253.1 biopolymer transporter ExbD [Lentibacter sp. XHP0401]